MTERTSFLAELKRRNVLRVAIAYVAVSWLALQAGALIFPLMDLPDAVLKGLFALLAIGFVPVLVFSWVYEMTPEGLKRESEISRDESITHLTGRKLDYIVIGVLAAVVGLLLIDKLALSPRRVTQAVAEAASAKATPESPAKATLDHGVPATAPPSAGTIPSIEADPSIAVLPLVNMSSDPEQEYFSDGISEELLNLLAKVPQLRVIARTSSFGYKGKNLPIPLIARELHVASVLEGSVRKSGDKVRITAQLIRASDGSHLWSETYDRTLEDIFKVQDEIAAAVVAQLKIKLLGAAPTATPVDPKAYPLILQAQALLDQQSKPGREQAAALYQQALAIAPNEARAWAGLSRVYVNQALFGERPAAESSHLAREAANKALAIDPDNMLALGLLARVASDFEADLPTSARYLQRAFESAPGNLSLLNAAGNLLGNIGRADEARRLFAYHVAHDPANATAHYNLAFSLHISRQWDAAIDAYRAALRLSPDVSAAHSGIALSLLGKKDFEGALKEAQIEPDELTRMVTLPMALHALGRREDARTALQALVDKFGADQPAYVATAFAYCGPADAAFEWLDKAAANRDPGVVYVLTDPAFDQVHQDPRWLPYLRTIGYAPEQLAKVELEVTLPQ